MFGPSRRESYGCLTKLNCSSTQIRVPPCTVGKTLATHPPDLPRPMIPKFCEPSSCTTHPAIEAIYTALIMSALPTLANIIRPFMFVTALWVSGLPASADLCSWRITSTSPTGAPARESGCTTSYRRIEGTRNLFPRRGCLQLSVKIEEVWLICLDIHGFHGTAARKISGKKRKRKGKKKHQALRQRRTSTPNGITN